jgi:hypothetical protein
VNNAEDKEKWLKALQKPIDTEIQLNLMNEITKESMFEDLNRVGQSKRDLMLIANVMINEVRKKKRKVEKSEKIEETKEKYEEDTGNANKKKKKNFEKKNEQSYSKNEEVKETESNPEDRPRKGFCSCLDFLFKKNRNGVKEPLIIN